ncbi:3-deoxy-D-manno-octulosonic acid transferase [Mariniblastus fucicola]|uniref:3-deoxy-D-manno-octulosonic acid transferase n=1 Tax=Mariniblastus fucicola TaxID=980251 RepID=A0A5B9PFE0_9BACT|nr:3-deoxy-D-manno-octulosonic acid transferase [Mariniblastus fucicola]QEG23915.1 3-deoxy-D-manno-octulosonic acid transferase [Mariniblastus fucicola]
MRLRSQIRTFVLNGIWLIILLIGLPWLAWRFVSKGKNRRGWSQKLFGLVPASAKPVGSKRIWLHAVSVGEVHLLNTLVGSLLQHHGDVELFISTTTETGYDRAVALFGDRHEVFFFPFDFSWAIRNVIRRIDPDLLVLAELELWPNLIHISADLELPVVVANGRLSENSHRNYRRFEFFTRPMFQKLNRVAAQDRISADRFVELGCDPNRVIVTGNLKYDAIETDRNNAKTSACRCLARDFGIADDDRILIAGSTQIEDESAAVNAWEMLRSEFGDLKLVIVPRHPDRFAEIESLLEKKGLVANRRSQHGSVSVDSDILVVDVIGELSGWWGLADVAFVGGSMGSRGGQNMIEPAAYGIPVCFGPNTANFQSTVDGLLAHNAAKVVEDTVQLTDFVARALGDRVESESMGKRAQEFVQQHRGAAARTVEILGRFLQSKSRKDLEHAA